MSYLRKFAREQVEDKKDKTFSIRVPSSFFLEFENHVNSLGLNVSESVYLLMQKEVNDAREKKRIQGNTNVIQEEGSRHTSVNRDDDKKTRRVKQRDDRESKNGGRFFVDRWLIDGQLPCPVCEKWINRKNFSRHARTMHEMTTQELIERHIERADAMARGD